MTKCKAASHFLKVHLCESIQAYATEPVGNTGMYLDGTLFAYVMRAQCRIIFLKAVDFNRE